MIANTIGVFPLQIVTWAVENTPDMTGAKSGRPLGTLENIQINDTIIQNTGSNVIVPTSPASGDLSGSYPAPQVVGLDGLPLSLTTIPPPAANQILSFNGTYWSNTPVNTLDNVPLAISSPTIGQAIVYNGTEFINAPPVAAVSTITPILFGALFALAPISSNQTVNIDGYSAVNDGGGGLFNWVAGSTYNFVGLGAHNASAGGSWVRQYSGAIDIKWMGAKGDAVTDDTAAIQYALTNLPAYTELFFSTGAYVQSMPLQMPQPLTLTGPHVYGTSYAGGQGGAVIDGSQHWTGPQLIIAANQAIPETITKVGNIYMCQIGYPFLAGSPGRPLLNFSESDVGCLSDLASVSTGVGSGLTFECFLNPQGSRPSVYFPIASSSGSRYNSAVDGTTAFAIELASTGVLRYVLTTTNGTITLGGGNVLTNAVHHVAVTYDGYFMKIWVDGVLDTSEAQTGQVVQSAYEDFVVGYQSGQYTMGAGLGNGVTNPVLIGSIRLSNKCLYTTNFTPPTTELTVIADGSTSILCNFDPANIVLGGTWLKCLSNYRQERLVAGEPIYLYMGHLVPYNSVINGPIVQNLTFQTGAPTRAGTGIYIQGTLYSNLSWLNINSGTKGVTILGGYGHHMEQCVVGASYPFDLFSNYYIGGTQSWGWGNYDNPGGNLNDIKNCQIDGGHISVLAQNGVNIDQLFVNIVPLLMDVYISSSAPNGLSCVLKSVICDDEASMTTRDCGLYVNACQLVTTEGCVWSGVGGSGAGSGSSSCPTYQLGSNGFVRLNDYNGFYNAHVPGVISFVAPVTQITGNFYGAQSIVELCNSSALQFNGVPYVAPGNTGKVIIPALENFGVSTTNFTANANFTMGQNINAFFYGQIIMTDTGTLLTTPRNVILPLVPGYRRTVINNTLQTLTFIGATGSGAPITAGNSAQIYCDGTNWNLV
jgi:hypothetical protein